MLLMMLPFCLKQTLLNSIEWMLLKIIAPFGWIIFNLTSQSNRITDLQKLSFKFKKNFAARLEAMDNSGAHFPKIRSIG